MSFYRIGFYDNIFGTDRMSHVRRDRLPAAARPDRRGGSRARPGNRSWRPRTDAACRSVTSSSSWHTITLDPAYVHITTGESVARGGGKLRSCPPGDAEACTRSAATAAWTYCSIEDNIVEARSSPSSSTSPPVALPGADPRAPSSGPTKKRAPRGSLGGSGWLDEPALLEAPTGFEPVNGGFANLCLTTWPRRRSPSS